jgi:hypothetical protein
MSESVQIRRALDASCRRSSESAGHSPYVAFEWLQPLMDVLIVDVLDVRRDRVSPQFVVLLVLPVEPHESPRHGLQKPCGVNVVLT